jgi:23S rRNA (guanosine2251-2'-O)-methyltransferase
MKKRKTASRRRDTGNSRSTERPSQPDGREWIYGRHAVLAALENPRREPGRLVATAEAATRFGEALAAAAPEILSRAQLQALLPEAAVHQGIALHAPTLPETPLENILDDVAASAVVVVLDQVTDPHNVGAVLRSAAAFAAAAVVVQDRSAPPSGGALGKAASGALDIVPLIRASNLARALEQLGNAGFWRIGFDESAELTLTEAPLDGRVALVLGAEGRGLRRLTRERCDRLARIVAPGKLDTLNVSNAAAIALYETERRNEAGR